SVPALASPVTNWGHVKVTQTGYYESHSTPCMFNDNGSYKLAVGSERGYLYMYGNIDGNLNGTFTLIDSTYNDIYLGEQMAPHLFDFNNDGILDMVIGNYSGGLAYFKGTANTNALQENMEVFTDLTIYPNPASSSLNLKFDNYNNAEKIISVYDAIGRKIIEETATSSEYTLNISSLNTGLYFIEAAILFPNKKPVKVSKKFVKE
ncbi:MAG TPA: T9SS type A sorting domain-containing protein, partial [Bacteroidia bacterium]